MKKIITIILTIIISLFGIIGCGSAKTSNKQNDDPNSVIKFDETPQEVISSSEMELSGEHNEFNEINVANPFFTDKDDNVIYTINALWRRFGNVSDGQNAVHYMGNEASWYEWMNKKFLWSSETEGKERLRNMIQCCPQSSNGYIWSWGTREYWLVQHTFRVDDYEKDAASYHFDGTFRFVGAVCDIVLHDYSTSFMNLKDFTRVNKRDVSQNMTVEEKMNLALNYIMEELDGKNGFIKLPENPTTNSNIDKYKLNYGNTGRLGSNSANYWDNYAYGHYSGYENILFYQMLNKLYQMEMFRGNEIKANEYAELAKKVKKNYDDILWNETNGRYIANVDIDGREHDYGLTFQNLKALQAGLGDKNKAEQIFSWINGDRIVENDTSKGKDIYYYKICPRTNTLAIESIEEDGKTWWRGPASIDVHSNASWDRHQTNGGFIFYSEYYDLMARLKYIGPEEFMKRWNVIYEQFCINGLISKKGWRYGIIAEFPENGIIPISYLDGLLGILPTYKGLEIKPIFPDAYNTMGVNDYHYAGKVYTITTEKNGTLIIDAKNGINGKFVYRPNVAKTQFNVTLFDENGNILEEKNITKDAEHKLYVDFAGYTDKGVLQIVIS